MDAVVLSQFGSK